MFRNKSKLTTLQLINCDCDGVMMNEISRNCFALTTLDLHHNPLISSDNVVAVLQHCSKIVDLDLVGCSQVTSSILSSVKLTQRLKVRGTKITHKEVISFNERLWSRVDCY